MLLIGLAGEAEGGNNRLRGEGLLRGGLLEGGRRSRNLLTTNGLVAGLVAGHDFLRSRESCRESQEVKVPLQARHRVFE